MKRNRHCGIIALIALFAFSLTVNQRAGAQTRRRTTTTARNTGSKAKEPPVSKPYTGYHKQLAGKAVDLGLSVLWADRNVGAASPADEGGLFTWGSVTGTLGKMAEHEEKPRGLSEIFSSTFDTAHMCWGGDWRMPSMEEFIELFTKCKLSKVLNSEGHYMLRLTGPNGNSITMPITGHIMWPDNEELSRDFMMNGYYWMGEVNKDTIWWKKGEMGKLPECFQYSPNQPLFLTIYSRGWYWSWQYPTIKDFEIVSVADCDRERLAMAVRPVMDRDGLPTTTKPKAGNTAQQAGNKGNTPRPQTTNRNNGGKTGKGNKKPATNSQNGNNGSDDNEQQKDAPIPTPKPEHDEWDSIPHHKNAPIAVERAVDLGLSVYWSDRNIGAKSISDPGDYFWWGVKEAKERKKQEVSIQGIPLNIGDINGTEYDIATAHWSARWRMPTKEEIQELMDNCTFELNSINGQKGVKITGKNKNWIFLPFGGGYDPYEGKGMIEGWSAIWSATECKNDPPSTAFGGLFSPFGKNEIMEISKVLLINVRPVTKRLLPPAKPPRGCE